MPVLPVLFVLLGAVAGAVAAEFLSPPATEGGVVEAATEVPDARAEAVAAMPGADEAADESAAAVERSIVPLGRRIIVPVVTAQRTEALVLLDVVIEVPAALAPETHNAIPKLRASFLTAMLSLSAGGAFDAGVADPLLLESVRKILTDRARSILPERSAEVLVLETLMRRV